MSPELHARLGRVRAFVERVARSLPFRMMLASIILYCHIDAMKKLAHDRFDLEWNRTPEAEPSFIFSETQTGPLVNWDRMLPARWDAKHYMTIGLRGYSKCKPRETFDDEHHPDDDKECQLNFYPTYGFAGAKLAELTDWPIDRAMFRLSLFASFGFLVLFTSRAVTDKLGLGTTYLALLLFNVFTSGFALVTIQTEPLLLLFLMLSYWCLHRRWLFAGALAAGAASAVRISGVAVTGAYAIALLVLTIQERPKLAIWVYRFFCALLGSWGIALLCAYYKHRFGDPLIYIHAHGREYHHEANLALVLVPDTRLLMQSIWAEPNDGLFLAAGLLWFALGHRRALVGFDGAARAYWYAIFAGVVGLSTVGSSEYAYGGLSRYMLVAIPLFFAIAAITRRRPLLLLIWLYISVAHYWGGSMCFYVGENEPANHRMCGFSREFIE